MIEMVRGAIFGEIVDQLRDYHPTVEVEMGMQLMETVEEMGTIAEAEVVPRRRWWW